MSLEVTLRKVQRRYVSKHGLTRKEGEMFAKEICASNNLDYVALQKKIAGHITTVLAYQVSVTGGYVPSHRVIASIDLLEGLLLEQL